PAALQPRAIALARDDDVEGVLQLLLGPGAAAAVVGQGGQGADDVEIALDLAEGAFLGPDAQQDLGRHAEPLGHLPRHAVDALAGHGDSGGRDRVLDIGAGRAGEFGLVAVQADDAGVRRHALQFAGVFPFARAAVALEEALPPGVEAGVVIGFAEVRL